MLQAVPLPPPIARRAVAHGGAVFPVDRLEALAGQCDQTALFAGEAFAGRWAARRRRSNAWARGLVEYAPRAGGAAGQGCLAAALARRAGAAPQT